MKRVMTAEWLDELSPTDPRAKRSRADLRRINGCMGHLRILARLLRQASANSQIEHLVDLGAGDGTFCHSLVRRVRPFCQVMNVSLVDRQPIVSQETIQAFASMRCGVQVIEADALEWIEAAPPSSVIFGNLFLHHFRDDELEGLFQAAARSTAVFLAVEPRRSSLALVCSRLLALLGCNDVTRHDAVVSVRAGFAGQELSRHWPRAEEWEIEEGSAGWFSHVLLARRRSVRSAAPASTHV